MPGKIDPNARTPERIRRNFQRIARGGVTSVTVVAPLKNSSSGVFLALDPNGGLETSSTLLRVKLDTSPGITRGAGGIKLLLTDTSLLLSGSGVQVNLAANSGLTVASGLKIGAITTKGDLFVFSTLPTRLAVGTNNQFLQADSTQATGLKWATPFVYNEVPSGTQNGSNTNFTLANTPIAGTVMAHKNGLRLKPTTDFTVSGTTITYVVAPAAPDVLLVDYQK
jgi:hypothetical protein